MKAPRNFVQLEPPRYWFWMYFRIVAAVVSLILLLSLVMLGLVAYSPVEKLSFPIDTHVRP
jgi:hypothetical protein